MHTGATTSFSTRSTRTGIDRAAQFRRAEVWLVAAALLATMLVPLLGKYRAADAPDSSPIVEAIWSAFYLLAGVRLLTMRAEAKALLAKSWPLLGFLALMLLSVIWSIEPATSFKSAVELIGTTAIGYYVVARFTLVELLDILALAFGSAAVLSLALIFGAPGHGRMDWGAGSWAGIFQDKNNLGAAMALGGISLLVLLFVRTGRMRLVLGALLAFFVTLLIGSSSATAAFDYCAVTAMLLAAWACRSRTIGFTARIVTVVAAVALGLAYLTLGLTPDSVFAFLGREPNLTGRTDFWPYLQEAIADRPLLGYGLDAFFRSEASSSYLSYFVVDAGGWTPYHAHNSFMQICLDSGFLGLGAFLFVLGGALWRSFVYAWRDPSRAALWPCAILLYLVLGSFTETYFPNFNTIEWVLLVTALLYPLRAREA